MYPHKESQGLLDRKGQALGTGPRLDEFTVEPGFKPVRETLDGSASNQPTKENPTDAK